MNGKELFELSSILLIGCKSIVVRLAKRLPKEKFIEHTEFPLDFVDVCGMLMDRFLLVNFLMHDFQPSTVDVLMRVSHSRFWLYESRLDSLEPVSCFRMQFRLSSGWELTLKPRDSLIEFSLATVNKLSYWLIGFGGSLGCLDKQFTSPISAPGLRSMIKSNGISLSSHRVYLENRVLFFLLFPLKSEIKALWSFIMVNGLPKI